MQKTLTCINVQQGLKNSTVQFGINDPKGEKEPQLVAVIQTKDPTELQGFTVGLDYIINVNPVTDGNKKGIKK